MAIFLSGRKRYHPPPPLRLLLHHTARLQEGSVLGGDLLFLICQSRAQQGKALSSQQSSLPRISLLNTALSETSFCSLKQSGINSVNIKFQARIRAQTQGDVSKCSSHKSHLMWLMPHQGAARGAGAQAVHPPPWWYSSPPKGSLPRLLQQERGMLKLVCLAGWKGKEAL